MQKLQISNKSLVEECRKGNKEALNLFYLRFAPRMLCVIHRYIRDDRDAEDVLHDGFIVDTRKEGLIKASFCCEGFMGSYEGKVRDYFFECQAGVTVASVLLDGGIGACVSIRADYRQGNIYEDDFWDVWQNRFGIYRDRQWMKTGACSDCKMWRYCEGNGMHLRDADGKLMHCHLC